MIMAGFLKPSNLFCICVFTVVISIAWLTCPAVGAPVRMVRCRSPLFGSCYLQWHACPPSCPKTCMVDCAICRPVCGCNYPGAVCQDPRFVGGDGITFYFHGRKNQDFCLVSDSNLHINAHFIGKRNTKLTRDFTWVQSIAILFDTHKLLISAKKTSTWNDNIDRLALSVDGITLSIPKKEGTQWKHEAVHVTRTKDVNGVTAEVAGNFKVTANVVPITAKESKVHGYNISTTENCFAHLELGFKFFNLTNLVDGVLGQTYRKNYVSKAKLSSAMSVLGGAEKFSSSSIYATDCKAAKFGKDVEGIEEGKEHPGLQCSSGLMKGNGVVCRK